MAHENRTSGEGVKYTKEEINKIINLIGADGNRIDIFDLYAVLFLGNNIKGTWDLAKTYTKYGDGGIIVSMEDFEGCDTEQEVIDRFCETLLVGIRNRLV